MIYKIRIQSALAYRFNVVSTILIQCLLMFAMACFWKAAYGGTGMVARGYESLAFLYGMSVLSHGLTVVLFIQTWYMPYCVIEGEYDMFLLRLMGVLFQFLFDDFNLIGITDMIPGLIVFFYGCAKVHLAANFTDMVGALFERVSMYPITIYPKWTQVLFTFILPLAWITFYPVKGILGMGGEV